MAHKGFTPEERKEARELMDHLVVDGATLMREIERDFASREQDLKLTTRLLCKYFSDDPLCDASGEPTMRGVHETLLQHVRNYLEEARCTGVVGLMKKKLYYGLLRHLVPKHEVPPDCSAEELFQRLENVLTAKERSPVHVILEESDRRGGALLRVLVRCNIQEMGRGTLLKMARVLAQTPDILRDFEREGRSVDRDHSQDVLIELLLEHAMLISKMPRVLIKSQKRRDRFFGMLFNDRVLRCMTEIFRESIKEVQACGK